MSTLLSTVTANSLSQSQGSQSLSSNEPNAFVAFRITNSHAVRKAKKIDSDVERCSRSLTPFSESPNTIHIPLYVTRVGDDAQSKKLAQEAISAAAFALSPLIVRLRGVKKYGYKKLVAVTARDDVRVLEYVNRVLHRHFSSRGFPALRPGKFYPHMTLFDVKEELAWGRGGKMRPLRGTGSRTSDGESES